MAINRFYQSSAPRYTSQFVEERFPEELIVQSGAMKYGQQQQFAKDIGTISSLNALLTPGYRTQRMAPEVKKLWSNKINELTTKFSKSYDTPQAAMELSRLRNDWLNDPNVQLIKQDYDTGNKERDAILRSTKTYHLDYDPNVDPRTGSIKQFNLNDPYTGYKPLVLFTDPSEQALKEFGLVKPDMVPQIQRKIVPNPLTGEDELVTVQGYTEYIDQNKLKPVIQSLVERTKKGGEDWSSYLRTRFRDRNGNLREPTDEELTDYFGQLSKYFLQSRTNLKADYPSEGSGSTGGGFTAGSATLPIASVKASDNYMQLNKTMIRQATLLNRFADLDIPIETNDGFRNVLHKIAQSNPSILKASEKDKAKALKQYIDETGKKQVRLDVDRFTDPAENKAATNFFFGDELVSGKMPKNFTGGMFMESQVYDMETGRKLEESEKKGLLKEENTAQVVGRTSADKSILSPFPVAWEVHIGEKGGTRRLLVPGSSQDIRNQKIKWNFYNFERHKDTGIGDPFQLDLYSGSGLDITDVSDFGKENDPSTLTETQPLYIVPMQDYTNTDINGNPSVKIKVYAYNPVLEEGVPIDTGGSVPSFATGIPGVGEGLQKGFEKIVGKISKSPTVPINKGLLDNTNQYFIKEYDLSDFVNRKDDNGKYVTPMNALIKQLLSDHEQLYTRKYEILSSMYQ